MAAAPTSQRALREMPASRRAAAIVITPNKPRMAHFAISTREVVNPKDRDHRSPNVLTKYESGRMVMFCPKMKSRLLARIYHP
jgi:hypothetical protein